MNSFEAKLDQQARERMARIRAEDDPLAMPLVPDALDPMSDGDDGFLRPSKAARRMDISISELLRLAEQGVLSTRGRSYGLRSYGLRCSPGRSRARARASAPRGATSRSAAPRAPRLGERRFMVAPPERPAS